ncbi:MAG: hypothetical protein AAFW46_03410 [Pseudomonadota bacterium]
MNKPPKRSPRDYLSAIFDTVLEEAERNPEFMERLADRLDDQVTVVVQGRRKGPAEIPPELRDMDLAAARDELGQIGLREKLAGYTNAALAAYIRARKLSETPPSKLNKAQLVNAIIRASKA